MKNIFLLLVLLAFPLKSFADEKGGAWFGGLVGKQKATAGGSIEPTSYGVTFGTMKNSLGFEGFLLTGSETVTVRKVSVTQSVFAAGGRLDIFAGKVLFIGPMLAYASVKTSAEVAGFTVAVTSTGMLYGGGGGFNIPLGKVSLGIEGAYLMGKISGTKTTVVSYLGSVKLWF